MTTTNFLTDTLSCVPELHSVSDFLDEIVPVAPEESPVYSAASSVASLSPPAPEPKPS